MVFPAAMLLIMVAAVGLPSAFAEPQPRVVVFGDSLSDNGNGYARTVKEALNTHEVDPPRPYFSGRFSNGRVWVEHVAGALKLPLLDYAAGGATSGAVPSSNGPLPKGFGGTLGDTVIPSPNFHQQVEEHLGTNPIAGSPPQKQSGQDFYIILMGNNDYDSPYLKAGALTPSLVVSNIKSAIHRLYNAGASKFLLVGLPDINTLIPATGSSVEQAAAAAQYSKIIDMHNNLLNHTARGFAATKPGAQVQFLDLQPVLLELAKAAPGLGFSKLATPCLKSTSPSRPGPVCADVSQHIFWDSSHPTASVHVLIAGAVLDAVGRNFFNSTATFP